MATRKLKKKEAIEESVEGYREARPAFLSNPYSSYEKKRAKIEKDVREATGNAKREGR